MRVGLTEGLWERPPPALRRRPRLLGALRLAVHLGHEIGHGGLGLRAAGLAFTTLLAIVPLLAVSFSVLKGLGAHDMVRPLLLQWLAPLGEAREALVGRIIAFVDNVRVGVLGSAGVLLLFYGVLSLLQKIEAAFNDIWRLRRRRALLRRMADYLSVLFVGPVLLFTAVGLSATLLRGAGAEGLLALAPIGALYRTLLFLLPYLLVIAAFTFLYVFLPNTAVRWRAALAGGLAAGLLWQSAGWVFTTFVGQAGRYTAIYSGFAVLILGMLWIYLNWLILLIGAQFAYFVQHPRRLRRPPQVAAPVWVDEWTALAVYAAVARAWYADRGGAAATVLALELDLDEQQVEDALALLSRTGWLDERVEAPGVFLPLSPPERHDALELYRAVHAARAPEAAVVRALRARYDQCLHECLSRLSLRDLAQGEDAAAAMDTSKGIRGDDERLA